MGPNELSGYNTESKLALSSSPPFISHCSSNSMWIYFIPGCKNIPRTKSFKQIKLKPSNNQAHPHKITTHSPPTIYINCRVEVRLQINTAKLHKCTYLLINPSHPPSPKGTLIIHICLKWCQKKYPNLCSLNTQLSIWSVYLRLTITNHDHCFTRFPFLYCEW